MLAVTKLGYRRNCGVRSPAQISSRIHGHGAARQPERKILALAFDGSSLGRARPCREPPRALGASQLPLSTRRSPCARQEPLHRTRILSKPRRLHRFSTSDARALFNIKRDSPSLLVASATMGLVGGCSVSSYSAYQRTRGGFVRIRGGTF